MEGERTETARNSAVCTFVCDVKSGRLKEVTGAKIQRAAKGAWFAMVMSALGTGKCTPCRGGSPQVTKEEIEELKPQIPEWTLSNREGIQQLERAFSFKDFAEALMFTNRVGALAEAEGHHPAILTEWGRVTVTLWTHKIHGLHRNDFIMAAKVDSLAAES